MTRDGELRESDCQGTDTLTQLRMRKQLSDSILHIQRRGLVSERQSMQVITPNGLLMAAQPNPQAFGSYNRGTCAFETALSLLPAEPSAAEKTLKKQCEEGLAAIQETITRLRHQENDSFTCIPVDEVNMDEFPWNRAPAILMNLSRLVTLTAGCVTVLSEFLAGQVINANNVGMGHSECSQSMHAFSINGALAADCNQ